MSAKKPLPSEEIQLKMVEDYRSGLNVKDIKYKYPESGWNMIPLILANHGIQQRSCNCKSLDETAHPFDTGFFGRDTPEAAYWAGFMMADGSCKAIGKSMVLRLAISDKDQNHIHSYCDAIGLNRSTVWYSKAKKGFRNARGQVHVQIRHSTLGDQLARFGVIPNKTDNFLKPDFPEELLPHYLRGWADGDGYIQVRPKESEFFKMVGNAQALGWYADSLRKLGWKRSIYMYDPKKRGWRLLVLFSSRDAQSIAPILRADLLPRLDRRWEKAAWRVDSAESKGGSDDKIKGRHSDLAGFLPGFWD